MISEIIIDNLIKNSNVKDKDFLLKLFIMNLGEGYSYNDDKVNRILEIMLDNSKLVKPEHIDMDYITEDISKLVYKGENYNFKDITIGSINNIEGVIRIDYKYLEKINEDRGDINYTNSYINISFIDNPKVLKKC